MNKAIFEELCLLKPEKYLAPKIKSYEDIIQNLRALKGCVYSEKLFQCIIILIVKKSEEGNRFRKKDCIKLIKNFRKKADKKISNGVISEKIFYLFKKYITSLGEEDSNNLSVSLKDLGLRNDEVRWLIKNASNVYVLNRILRYPMPSKDICAWAKQQLKQNNFTERKSELMGYIIDYNENYSHKNRQALAWGIYYSRINSKAKIKMLRKLLKFDKNTEAVEVASRLGYIKLLEANI